ncbi:MAG: bacterial Ig-like domain-containing protein [Treponema sp.]|nr:bacterial Ig-like domain-containing protein [Treponema sp.]
MKKLRFVKALFAALVLVLALPSCSDFDGAEGTDAVQTQGNKVALKISAGNGYERTALPGEIDLTNDNYAFTLEGTPKGKSLQCYAKDYSYSDLIGAKKIYVEEGEYDSFTLHVSNPNTWILAGTVSNVTISAENNSLKFKLFAEESETETGSVSIEVTVPAEYGVQTVTALLNDETTSSLTISEIADGKATITGSVPAGQSMIKIALLDADGTEVGSYYDSVYAVAGITSSDSLTVPVLKYKASVNVTTTATTAPTVTLKNNDATLGAADIVLTSTSTESPFAYTKYVPMGTYNVYVGNDPHGSLSNVTQLAVNTNVTLQSISAAWTDGTQPRFYVGATEAQILAALTVTGTYKDGDNNTSTQAIASGCTLSGYDSASTATTQTVKVVYSEKESAEITVTLTPVSVASIEIKNDPTKTVYKLGKSLDLAGLVITPTMNNGTTGDDVAYSDTTASDFAASGFDSSSAAAANKTVTITYKNIETATATFSVKIIALAGIEITTLPTKTTGYKSTDTELDLTGMVVTATYTDGTTDGLNASGVISTDENATVVTDDVTVSEPDFTQSGEQTVTVTYKEGSGDLQQTETTSFNISVLHDYAEAMTLDFTGSTPAGIAWNGVPIRGSGNVAALVTRTEGSFTGYLGRKFWLVDGVYAEYCNSTAGLGYTDTKEDKDRPTTQTFAKAVESEAITGPFKLTVTTTTNNANRLLKLYVHGNKADLWNATPVVSEALNANSGVHTYEYTGTESVYIGFGTLSAKDGDVYKVYTAISSIKLETDTPIPADSFPATGIAFTNSEIAEGVLSLTKDTLAAAGTTGFALEAQVTPSYATDKTYSFAYTTEAATPHISVSEAGVIVISDADSMTANETGTITVTANGGTNVSATIALTVVAQVDDATKIATTKTELEAAFGTGTTFEYGSVATAAGSATAFINNLSLSYKDDVTITPTVDESTGKLTLTVSIAGSSADSATVEYAYTETLALAAVTAAVAQIKALANELVWNTDAATTVSNINTAIGGLTITDATATAAVSATDSDVVVVTVASTIVSTVKDETITVSSPFVKVGKYNLTTKAKEGYTVDGSATGAWSSQSAGKTQTHDRMTITSTIDSSGANIKPSSQNSGCITFTLGSPMAMKFTDSNKKGIEIFSADGTVNGKSVSDASYTAGKGSGTLGADGTETTVNLSAGTYFVYGASTGGSAKLATLVFVEIISSPIDITENLPTGDVELKTDTTNANKFIASGAPVTADATIIWYVDDVAQTTGTSQTTVAGDTFTLTGTIGVTYEVRVDVTVNGITYSQTESVMYQ